MSASPQPPSSGASKPSKQSKHQLEQAGASDASITEIHEQLRREKPEPTEGFSPIPIAILFIFSGLIFYGGIYLGTKSGGFSPLAFDVEHDYGAKVAEAPKVARDPMKYGQQMYTQNCVACHQPNGMGQPGAFPPLGGSDWMTGSEEIPIRIVLNGLAGPIEVAGQSFNGAMPPLGPALNDEKIAAVLTFARASFGNSAPPVSIEKVKEIRAAVGNRTKPWTAEELQQFK